MLVRKYVFDIGISKGRERYKRYIDIQLARKGFKVWI